MADDDVIAMAKCSHCHHFVPEDNFPLHEARCSRKRPATHNTNGENEDEDRKPAASSRQQGHGRKARGRPTRSEEQNGNTENQPFLPRASWERPPTTAMEAEHEITTIIDDSMEENDEVMEIPPVTAAAAAVNPPREVIDLVSDGDGWNCPHCTLINSTSLEHCGACNYRSPQYERPADPTRRDRLVNDMGLAPGNSPLGGLVGGGALLGSLLGASGAYMRGKPVTSGVLNGALTGAVGGAVLNEAMRHDSRQEHRTARPVVNLSSRTTSLRLVRTPEGRVLMQQSRGGGVPHNSDYEMLMMQLMAGQQRGQPYGAASTDNMSYEQLLQRFGSGTENLRASEGQISSLPSAIVEDANRLPVDSRQCSICLEDFASGEERKIMPCLHGFHAVCLDKWLRNNGSCPMCKHRLGR
jgi:hypothetical protein